MTEEVEPHPLLIEYLQIAYNLNDEDNKNLQEFFEAGEWHYIQADIETNIFLLKRLDEEGLLSSEVNICDCGIGLGTILYDLYLQSKEFLENPLKNQGLLTQNCQFLNQKMVQYQ